MKGGLRVFGKQVYGTNKRRELNTLLSNYESEDCFNILNDPTQDKTWTKSKTKSCNHILDRVFRIEDTQTDADNARGKLKLKNTEDVTKYKHNYCIRPQHIQPLCDIVDDYTSQILAKTIVITYFKDNPQGFTEVLDKLLVEGKITESIFNIINDKPSIEDKVKELINTDLIGNDKFISYTELEKIVSAQKEIEKIVSAQKEIERKVSAQKEKERKTFIRESEKINNININRKLQSIQTTKRAKELETEATKRAKKLKIENLNKIIADYEKTIDQKLKIREGLINKYRKITTGFLSSILDESESYKTHIADKVATIEQDILNYDKQLEELEKHYVELKFELENAKKENPKENPKENKKEPNKDS
jgi:hypothetical protein